MNSQTKGDLAELRVAATLRQSGHTVLFPFTENEQYDLAIDIDGEFIRVQVKHAAKRDDGRIVVSCYGSNSSKSGNNTTIYTKDDIDGIAAFCSDTEECFWIPFEDMNRYTITLSEAGKHRIDDYRIGRIK